MRIAKVIPNIEWTHLRQVLEDYAAYFIQEARSNLGKNKSYASGELGDSMSPVITIGEDYFKVEIRIKDYWEYVEKGRKAGKFPPVNKIKEWIMVKPVKPKVMTLTRVWYVNNRVKGAPKDIRRERKYQHLPSINELTYLIGRKIEREGIPPRPFFKPALENTKAYFEQAIEYAIDEDVAAYIEQKILNQMMYEGLL